jgi:hypothetical protein
MWRRKVNKELIEKTETTPIKYYIRCQIIQWFEHIMHGSDNKIIKTVICLGYQRVKKYEDV